MALHAILAVLCSAIVLIAVPAAMAAAGLLGFSDILTRGIALTLCCHIWEKLKDACAGMRAALGSFELLLGVGLRP
ncbi:MAG TPA: hypothetical protein VG866_00945 [Candidatus Paceibacterota bacterium]|nr:hypothetical protein [Candidatus Paceibacterota bacterium]